MLALLLKLSWLTEAAVSIKRHPSAFNCSPPESPPSEPWWEPFSPAEKGSLQRIMGWALARQRLTTGCLNLSEVEVEIVWLQVLTVRGVTIQTCCFLDILIVCIHWDVVSAQHSPETPVPVLSVRFRSWSKVHFLSAVSVTLRKHPTMEVTSAGSLLQNRSEVESSSLILNV